MNQSPQSIDPIRLAEAQAKLAGAMQLRSLGRLQNILFTPEGEVVYEISFKIDEMGQVVIEGRIFRAITTALSTLYEYNDLYSGK